MNPQTQTLVAQATAGDQAACSALYAAHAGWIKAYFLRSAFTTADADDLTQEVFIRAFRSIETFDANRGSFSTWVASIARNVARKFWSRQQNSTDFDPELAEMLLLSPGIGPGQSAEQNEIMTALSQCIDALPADLAKILHLRYVQGRTTRGISAATGIPEATVRLRLTKIVELLEQCLDAKGFLE